MSNAEKAMKAIRASVADLLSTCGLPDPVRTGVATTHLLGLIERVIEASHDQRLGPASPHIHGAPGPFRCEVVREGVRCTQLENHGGAHIGTASRTVITWLEVSP